HAGPGGQLAPAGDPHPLQEQRPRASQAQEVDEDGTADHDPTPDLQHDVPPVCRGGSDRAAFDDRVHRSDGTTHTHRFTWSSEPSPHSTMARRYPESSRRTFTATWGGTMSGISSTRASTGSQLASATRYRRATALARTIGQLTSTETARWTSRSTMQ